MPGETFHPKEEAVLLTDTEKLSSQERNIEKLLAFFGVSWRTLSATRLPLDDDSSTNLRLVCSSATFAKLTAELTQSPLRVQQWRRRIHSVFLYASGTTAELKSIVGGLDRKRVVNAGSPFDGKFSITKKFPELCGAMTGLSIASEGTQEILTTTDANDRLDIISTERGPVFWKDEYDGAPVFVSTGQTVIDLDARLGDGIFDIRRHVLDAIPIVLYIKWAFPQTAWSALEDNACLIIDDPLLKPRYGFVEFGELLSLMKRHRFSTNIAFIPWNWQRSNSEVTRLFRENPDYLSISVHGCAHTRAEFGSDSSALLDRKTRQALRQMEWHRNATGIAHDRVMVFPQGVFSEAAMRVLKRTNVIASVNNDTISSDADPRPITIADVWDVALMCYDSFPLFTRRNPWEGVENFAFDCLLGKPVLIVIHHDFCRDHCRRLIDFIERLNGVARPLTWRSLGEVVRRSCRQRVSSPGIMQVEMYASELHIESRTGTTTECVIRKLELDPGSIRNVFLDNREVFFDRVDNGIQFTVELGPLENALVQIQHETSNEQEAATENLTDKTRIALRRYLCELRDNYFHKLGV